MKKGQVYQGIVERVAFPNKGVITLEDGKKAIVKNVIPGQKVSFWRLRWVQLFNAAL